MKKFALLFLLLFLAFSISLAAPKCDNPPCDGQGSGNDGPPGQDEDGPPGKGPGGAGPPGQSGASSDDVGLLPIFLTPFKGPVNGVRISISPPKITKNRQVTLKLKGGLEAAKMTISNYPDLREAGQEDYSPTKKWDLCSKIGGFITYPSCPSGTYTVYAKFYNQYGQASPVVSDSVKLLNNSPAKSWLVSGGKSRSQLAQAIQLTQIQVIDLLKELVGFLKNQIKLLSK